jgi:nitroimidazol reductase NimA-like FMN-containing flavoprotein (pyridoxamine 5'-phosphate oxidase superfamily)
MQMGLDPDLCFQCNELHSAKRWNCEICECSVMVKGREAHLRSAKHRANARQAAEDGASIFPRFRF